MPPSVYTSTTMYYATFKDPATSIVLLIPAHEYWSLKPQAQARFVSLVDLGFSEAEQIMCASLIDWLRSVRRIHTSTVALYTDALEEEEAYGSCTWSLQCYKNATTETAAALAAAREECRKVFVAVATALRSC